MASPSDPVPSGRGPSFEPQEDVHIDCSTTKNGVSSICISLHFTFMFYYIFTYAYQETCIDHVCPRLLANVYSHDRHHISRRESANKRIPATR